MHNVGPAYINDRMRQCRNQA